METIPQEWNHVYIYNCQMTIEYADALKVCFWFIYFFVCAEYMYFCILAEFIYKEKLHNDIY